MLIKLPLRRTLYSYPQITEFSCAINLVTQITLSPMNILKKECWFSIKYVFVFYVAKLNGLQGRQKSVGCSRQRTHAENWDMPWPSSVKGKQLADERGIKRGEEALVKAYHGECFLTIMDLLCRDLLRLPTCFIRSSISCGISCRTERVVACRRSQLWHTEHSN